MSLRMFVEAMSGVLFDVAVKATVLLFISWLATQCLVKSSAAVRHRILSLTMLGLILLPVLSWRLPPWQWAVLPATAAAIDRLTDINSVETKVPATNETAERLVQGNDAIRAKSVSTADESSIPNRVETLAELSSEKQGVTEISWMPLLLVSGWMIGLGVCLSGLGIGLWHVRRLSQQSLVVNDHEWRTLIDDLQQRLKMQRSVELRECAQSFVPLTWGVFRPVVILPLAARTWSFPMRNAVLLHELAHVRRADVALQLIGRLACALYWFHPLAWSALRQMRQEREQACDDAVLHAGERASHYAEQLLEVARRYSHPGRLELAVGMAQGNTLEQRLRVMFDASRSHAPLNGIKAIMVFAMTGFLLCMVSVVQPVAMEPAVAAAEQKPPKSNAAAAEPAQKPANEPTREPTQGTTGKIDGTILIESTNLPVADVEVCMVSSFTLPLNPQKSISNAKGEFVFEGLKPGTYHVYCFTPDLASRTSRFQFARVLLTPQGVQQSPLRLMLRPGVTLRVRVKSALTGKPVPDAFVQFRWTDLKTDHFTASDQGEVVIPNLTAEQWHVEVAAKGYARIFKDVELHSPETAIDLTLPPGGEVSGTVVDGSGTPMPNVRVAARSEKSFTYFFDQTTSDSLGRFHVGHIAEDQSLRIDVSAEGYQFRTISHRLGDPDAEITLKSIPDAGDVSGQIVDHSGRPIIGARIRNQGSSSDWVREAVSGEDGKFRIEHLYSTSEGAPSLVVRAEGCIPVEVSVTSEHLSGKNSLVVRLKPGHGIRGQVVDQRKQPVGGCWVFYIGGSHGFGGTGGRVIADGEGRFEITSLPAKSEFEFVAQGFSRYTTDQLKLDQNEAVTVTLGPMGTIVGNAADAATGKPIKDFTIRLSSAKRLPQGAKSSSGIDSTRVDPGESFVPDDGHFVLDRFDDGTAYDLLMTAPGYEQKQITSIIAVPLETAKPVKFELQRIK